MGCINSTKKLSDIKFDNGRSENVYRVRVIRLLNDTSAIRSGFLELTPKELIFSTQGREPIVWSLQHLRRYGINGDIFSFEAGRRCVTGPGIYVFRCQQAESLYLQFQLHVNAVSPSDDHHFSNNSQAPASNSTEFNLQHTNNYLEPVPLSAGFRERGAGGTEYHSMSSGELMNIDSPVSVPSLSFTNEMVHFQGQHQQATTNTYQNSNLYQEYPMNNNNKKLLLKRASLDVPPDDKAPGYHMRLGVDANPLHMYENIGAATTSNTIIKNNVDELSERCYENFSRIDLPLLLQMPPSSKEMPQEKLSESAGGAMNYIVLDLDNSNKTPTQSPKTITTTDENATFLTAALGGAYVGSEQLDGNGSLLTHSNNATNNDAYDKPLLDNDSTQELQLSKPTVDTSLGYSTIDFIKTCALIKSSTYGSEFDQEESRITRHSKCVRKAFSISE